MEDVIIKHSNMVYRLALSQTKNKSDADDVFQEVFFRYIRKEPSFLSDEHEKAWFIRVTLNCCKNLWTSAWMKKIVPLDESMPYLTGEQHDLMSELQKLPQKYMTVVHLHYYEDMSVNEISEVIGKSPSAVKMRLSRAREMLKEHLGEDYDV
ncbi:MAG: sigma-70 family RNA polymerase sigma factor [Oscillospiraceae bacterium]|nr:sigma-70 family RNA polymerase sigma factor [Oscillospiraceae bacterium]